MYSAAFSFEPGEYDAEFHRLNAIIDAVARAAPGFAGVESWQAVDGGRVPAPRPRYAASRCSQTCSRGSGVTARIARICSHERTSRATSS